MIINLTLFLPLVTGSSVIKKSFVISLSKRLFVREKINSKELVISLVATIFTEPKCWISDTKEDFLRYFREPCLVLNDLMRL